MSDAIEIKRRVFGVMEAIMTAALLGMAGMVFSTREAVIRSNETLQAIQSQLNQLPVVTERGIRNETEIKLVKERVADIERELRAKR